MVKKKKNREQKLNVNQMDMAKHAFSTLINTLLCENFSLNDPLFIVGYKISWEQSSEQFNSISLHCTLHSASAHRTLNTQNNSMGIANACTRHNGHYMTAQEHQHRTLSRIMYGEQLENPLP